MPGEAVVAVSQRLSMLSVVWFVLQEISMKDDWLSLSQHTFPAGVRCGVAA
jgi:hypothetical protein